MKFANSIFVIALSVILCSQDALVEGYRILGLFPLHGKSHFVMSEQLMKGLARKGHTVDVVSHFPQKKPYKNYNDLSLEGSMPDIVNNMTFDSMQRFTSFSVERFVEAVGDPVCELLGHPVVQDLIKNANKVKYDAIVVEIFSSNCFLVFGQLLKAPMIGLVTAAWLDWLNLPLAHPYNAATTPHAFSYAKHPMNFWQRLENTIVAPKINFDFHYHMDKQLSFVHKYVGKQFDSIYDLHKDLSVVLVNSHHSINGIKSLSPLIVEVGGLHVVDDNSTLPPEVEKWLDSANQGCVYMSFGSMVKIESFPKKTLDIFYETIKRMAPVKFLIKIAKKNELPPGLPSNAMTYHWLPQIKVLQHKNVKAFVTHGGLMGTLESIRFAVPMVGFPLFGDQHINIENYRSLKLAVAMDHKTVTTDTFVKALKTVLEDPEYRSSIKKTSELYFERPIPALDTAVYWIEYVVKYGKVLQPPGMHMPWWKNALLDVYAFIMFVVCVSLYIACLILKLVLRLFTSSASKKVSAKKKN